MAYLLPVTVNPAGSLDPGFYRDGEQSTEKQPKMPSGPSPLQFARSSRLTSIHSDIVLSIRALLLAKWSVRNTKVSWSQRRETVSAS